MLEDVILLCKAAENNYVGMGCGILDQFSSNQGVKDCVLSERGESLCEATTLAEKMAAGRARAQLNKLLAVTERVSRDAKPERKARA